MKPVSEKSFVGIDVSKEWMDIAIGNKCFQIPQHDEAIEKFISERLIPLQPSLCVVESTGGYERLITKHLQNSKLKVHIAHPNRVRSFAKAKGLLAKSDKLDAFVLASFGEFVKGEMVAREQSEEELKLQDLYARYAQIQEMAHAETCRLNNCIHADVKKHIKRHLDILKNEAEIIEEELKASIEKDESMVRRIEILRSMKGVGVKTSYAVLIGLPEIGELTRKQVAALVGVAPMTNQSGKKIGKSRTQQGRGAVRRELYMAALVAVRHNPIYKDFYERLTGRGKLPKVALVAVMRKMVVTLNAMVRTDRMFVM